MLIQKKKKLKIAEKKQKLRVKSRKKNGEKWLLGFGHFFWAGVFVAVVKWTNLSVMMMIDHHGWHMTKMYNLYNSRVCEIFMKTQYV